MLQEADDDDDDAGDADNAHGRQSNPALQLAICHTNYIPNKTSERWDEPWKNITKLGEEGPSPITIVIIS